MEYKPSPCVCDESYLLMHPLTCKCDRQGDGTVSKIYYPERYARRSLARLKEIWAEWGALQKEVYVYWFELAKPLEEKQLDAAKFATWKVELAILKGEVSP